MNKGIVKKGLFILLVLAIFPICGLIGNAVNSTPQNAEWHWPDSIKDILIIPDSLLFNGDSITPPMKIYTPEQKKLAISITTLMLKYTKVKDNRMVFEMSREEFLKTGIPEAYYDPMIHSYKNTNDFMDRDTFNLFGNVADRWEETKEEFRLQMELDVK
ncbi:hypothetical protein [Dysgonomonas sp. HGC4]|uniref:hypothetical protein n=1 Tax=Dysgonomonas sp. HGC4 TaxID=1658009 RepID=UPI00067FA139|nr:hypothetical protein [Dysgonomonas sp. HGC4]MBD8347951.1 hypothetical protein [Dysgonomonas sp. HGC4]